MEIRGLEGLAQASTDFVTAVFILAGLSAALILAVYELGLRHMMNRWLVTTWLRKKTDEKVGVFTRIIEQWFRGLKQIVPIRAPLGPDGEGEPVSFYAVQGALMSLAGSESTLYALRHQQLSGLVGSAVQSALDHTRESPLLDVFAAGAREELGDLRYRSSDQLQLELVAHQLERGVDELQTYLAKLWGTLDYALAFIFSLSLVALLVFLPSDFRPEGTRFLFFSVGLTSGLLAPLVRRLLERILSLG